MRNSVEAENIPCLKSMPKNSKNGKQTTCGQSKKMPLNVIQPSAANQQQLVGKNGVVGLQSQTGSKKKKSAGVKEKSQTAESVLSINETKCTEETSSLRRPCDVQDEAYRLMISETIPSDYWQEVAEQRRLALEVALKENEELHLAVANLTEENSILREMAEQAEHLSKILKSLTEEEDASEED